MPHSKHNVLRKFYSLSWAIFITNLGYMRSMGHRLDMPERGLREANEMAHLAKKERHFQQAS